MFRKWLPPLTLCNLAFLLQIKTSLIHLSERGFVMPVSHRETLLLASPDRLASVVQELLRHQDGGCWLCISCQLKQTSLTIMRTSRRMSIQVLCESPPQGTDRRCWHRSSKCIIRTAVDMSSTSGH